MVTHIDTLFHTFLTIIGIVLLFAFSQIVWVAMVAFVTIAYSFSHLVSHYIFHVHT